MKRYQWPKAIPPLTPEQQIISDDFMRHWHEILPGKYGIIERFNHGYPLKYLPAVKPFRTIELGAGLGEHLNYEDISIQEYHCVELRENMASEIQRRFPKIKSITADCQDKLPYPDGYFDRSVAIHVFEHLHNLPRAVDELARVMKPGGIVSMVIPCDPGFAYAIARKISAEKIFKKRYDIPYKYFINREHINNPDEILSVMAKHMTEIDRCYFPLGIPIRHVNLCMGITYQT